VRRLIISHCCWLAVHMALPVYCFNWTQSSRLSLAVSRFAARRRPQSQPTSSPSAVAPPSNLPTATLQTSKETYLLSHNLMVWSYVISNEINVNIFRKQDCHLIEGKKYERHTQKRFLFCHLIGQIWHSKQFRYTNLTLLFYRCTCVQKINCMDEVIRTLEHYRHTPVTESTTMPHLRVVKLNT